MTNAEKTKPEAAKDMETGESSSESPKPRAPHAETQSETTAKTAETSTPKAEKPVKKQEEKTETGKEAAPEKKEEQPENDLLVKFTVTVPHTKFEEEFNQAMLKYASDIKLPGFRRGKVPLEVIKSRYKEAIRDEVVGSVIETAVLEKIDADKIKVIAQPVVKKIDAKEGKDISADIEVEVFPTVELPYLENIEVEIPAAELKVDDYDEQKQIDMVLDAHKRQVPVRRAIKADDVVMLQTQAKILQTKRMTPRKSIRYLVNEEHPVEILDLAKELMDKNIDDNLTFRRSYPEDYHKKPWAGKEIEHYITIENVFEWEKPELNKDFLTSLGVEDEENFKKKLKEEYDQVNSRKIENKKLSKIMDTLCETIVFPLPPQMVEQEALRLLEQRQQRYPVDFKDENQVREHMNALKPEAEKSIRFSFIVEAIKEKFNLQVSGDDLENQYKRFAEEHNVPVKEVRKYYMNKENAQDLKDTMIREKVMTLIKGKVQVKEV